MGWIDRSVTRLQSGQMGGNGSRMVTRLEVIPAYLTASRWSNAQPAFTHFAVLRHKSPVYATVGLPFGSGRKSRDRNLL